MRLVVRSVVLAIALAFAPPACAQEMPPADQPVPPDETAPAAAAPPPSSDLTPLPQVPYPETVVPSPVSPSKTNEEIGVPRPLPPMAEQPPPGPPPTPVPDRTDNFVDFSAEQLRTSYEEGAPTRTVAVGNVVARYRNMEIRSDQAEADYRTNRAYFEGSVVFRIDAQEAQGERLELDLRTREWSFVSAKASIRPEFVQGYLRAPVFVSARSLEGLRTTRLSAYDVEGTTCELPRPHYELLSRSVTVYPGSKIIFRHATFCALGRRLFTLARLVVPLRDVQQSPGLIPRVGSSLEEGYFLKTSYAYVGTRLQTGLLLLDLMSQKGVGYGVKHTYSFAGASGLASIYQLNDRTINQNTLTGQLTHTQRFGTIRANLSSDYRKNSYLYAPESTSMINQLTLSRDRPGAVSSLVVSQNINDAFERTESLTGTLKHRQLFGQESALDASFDYNSFQFQNETRARLTSLLLFSRKEDKFDWNLSAEKVTDLSDEAFVGGGLFAGVERLPELAITSDTARLGNVLPLRLPGRLTLSYGQYRELPAGTELGRAHINIEVPTQRHNVTSTWTLAAGGGFRQFLYSDSTAQYYFGASADLRKKLGANSSFALTYRRQQPRGFTPFRFDFAGRYDIINASLNLQDSRVLKASLLAGYNFEQKRFPWQDIVLRFSYQPTGSLLLYTATGYDINNSKWRTLVNQIRVRAGEDFRLDLGTSYDTARSKLAMIRGLLDTKLGSKMRLQAVAGYNGFTRDFDYRSFMLTRDLHCWEASLVFTDQGGFYRNKSLMLNLRIKAFPLFDTFGMGPFGQALDTSVGQVY